MLTSAPSLATIERAVADALVAPGLMPRLTAAALYDPPTAARLTALIGDPRAHAARSATALPPELLRAWTEGLVILIDAGSAISERCVVHAKRLVVRDSAVGAFSAIYGDAVLIERSVIKGHAVFNGPLVVQGGLLSWHVLVGPTVVIVDSTVGAFCKAQRQVCIVGSRIGAGTQLEGGTHPEMLPLGPRNREVGVHVGPDAWVGQQCSVTAGAVVGAGVVVAAQTSVTRPVGEHVFVSGAPARAAPIDLAIRGLSAEAAVDEGRLQGAVAAGLPIFGRPDGSVVSPALIRIAYPGHGYARGLASARLLDFQQGVLTAALTEFFPGNPVTVRFDATPTVVFHASFARPLPAEIAFRDPALAQRWAALMTAPTSAAAVPTTAAAIMTAPGAPGASTLATIEAVTEVLARLLSDGVRIEPDATFDALGLDSLGKVELSVRLEERFEIPAPDVFANPTPRALAAAIDQQRTTR